MLAVESIHPGCCLEVILTTIVPYHLSDRWIWHSAEGRGYRLVLGQDQICSQEHSLGMAKLESMERIHLSETEVARELQSLLAQVKEGIEIIMEQENS